MLALRNAVCNDRWREMWQKALHHHRKLRALQRSARVEQRAQTVLAVGNSSRLSSPPPSAAVPEQLSPPAPFQPVSGVVAPLVLPPPPVPKASQPSSCCPSSRRKRHTARNQVKYSHQKSSEMSGEVCSCGTPLARFKGHRTKQYCSDRCRQRAYRKRQMQTKPLSALRSAASLSGSSRAPARSWHKRAARRGSEQVNCSLQRSGGVKGETCLFCGTRLSQSRGGRLREYCSGRCRQRAHRERQAQVSCA